MGKLLTSEDRTEASNRPAPVGRLNLDAIKRHQLSYNSAYRQNTSILIPVDTSSTERIDLLLPPRDLVSMRKAVTRETYRRTRILPEVVNMSI